METGVPSGGGVWIATTATPGSEGLETHTLHAKVVSFSDEALEVLAQRVAAVLAANPSGCAIKAFWADSERRA
jgi:hypothetical protein